MGTPYFKKVKVNLSNGNTITIEAPANSKENRYISDMTVNGKDYTKRYLTHDDLVKGASIRFNLSNQPNKNRSTEETDYPYSFSNDLKKKKK